jgi:hypothetical protein
MSIYVQTIHVIQFGKLMNTHNSILLQLYSYNSYIQINFIFYLKEN